MGEVITFTSGKGGVGKTTSTANVGVGLSLLDKKVILVDTDIGLRNLDVVMGLENRILYNLVDVLRGRCRVKQAIIKDKRFPNLSIIPSSCTKDPGSVEVGKMKQLLADLREEYDYVLVDSPAGIEQGFELALADTDRVIIVTTPQIAAIHDADCVLQILKKQKLKELNLLINGFRTQMVKDGDMLDVPDICELLDAKLLGVVLEDESIIIAQNHGSPVMGQHTVSESCYRNIAGRITGEEIPIPDYMKPTGIFSRLFWKHTAAKNNVTT
ncbi:MAG: septum site-determining protein MinD [Roseburia sp.]|nr:septum site-determining protein MinD [Roseburia sp.]